MKEGREGEEEQQQQPESGATYDRDAGAARNILMRYITLNDIPLDLEPPSDASAAAPIRGGGDPSGGLV